MKKISKIILLVLTLSMLISAFSVLASASVVAQDVAKVGDKWYATFADAWDAAMASPDDDVTITLYADTKSFGLTFINDVENKKITVDLNGHTYTSTRSESNDSMNVFRRGNQAPFFLRAEGTKLAFKNGNILLKALLVTTGEVPDKTGDAATTNAQISELYVTDYLTTVELDNVLITKDRDDTAARDLTFAFTKTVYNFNNVVIDTPYDRVFRLFGAAQLNLTDCYVNCYHSPIMYATLLEEMKEHKDFMDWNFTNCKFVASVVSTATGGNGRFFRNSNDYEISVNDTDLYTYDPETKVVTNSLPDANFYNCEFYASGNTLIYGFGDRNFHFYGGHVSLNGETKNLVYTAKTNSINEIAFHKDPVSGEYPSFTSGNYVYKNKIVKGLYDAVTKVTEESGVVSGFTTSNNVTGAIYPCGRGYTFIPNSDTEALSKVKAGVEVTAYWSGWMLPVTYDFSEKSSIVNKSQLGMSLSRKSATGGVQIDGMRFDPNGDAYGLYQWTEAATGAGDGYELWYINGKENVETTSQHHTVADVDYMTFEIDIKRPAGKKAVDLNWTGMNLATLDSDGTSVSNEVLTQKEFKNWLVDDNWHNLTVIVDSTNDTANKMYVFTDGTLLKCVDITMPADVTKAAFSRIRWNLNTGNKAEGEGLCRDNFKVTLYGYNTDVAYVGFSGISNATKLSDIAEYSDFAVRPTAAARIGNNFYTSFDAAYAAAVDGDRIELYVDAASEYKIEKLITVETNGYAFNYTTTTAYKVFKRGTDDHVLIFAAGDAKDDAGDKLEYTYSFAVVGDTQYITKWDAALGTDYISYIYDWILDNADEKNIQFVFGLGDITDSRDRDTGKYLAANEWAVAKNAITKLDGVIPYTLVRGNHDSEALMNSNFANSTYMSQFVDPDYDDNSVCFYEQGNVVNAYTKFTVGKTKYMNVVLEHAPSDEVLEWANEVVAANPDYRVIVTTHGYIDENLEFDYDDTNGNYAEKIWDNLVSRHRNIFLVLGGHVSKAHFVMNQRVGIYGNTVTEMCINPQSLDADKQTDNKRGMVAMLYFTEDGMDVKADYISTVQTARNPDKTDVITDSLAYNLISREKTDFAGMEHISVRENVDTYVFWFENGLCEAIDIDRSAGSFSVVSVEKTATVGLVDTYTITFSNGQTTTFTVTNGANGQNGADGLNGTNGTNGLNGADGKDGADGIDGINGTNGADGKDGKDGKDGLAAAAVAVGGVALGVDVLALLLYLIKRKKRA